MIKQYILDLRHEFAGYNAKKLSQDLMAGITVAAVALPLALAFGVSSGLTAASGLITAIVAGMIISIFSGASYQISGPTGAMGAILGGLVLSYGEQGVFIATLLAGIILVIAGIFKLRRLVTFIPSPVITGFTSGIAIIIALGQIDNFFGTTSEGASAIAKLASYAHLGFSPNMYAVLFGALVMVIMIVWPKKWNQKIPSSLVGIIVSLVISMFIKADYAVVGEIPRSLMTDSRLEVGALSVDAFKNLISPAFAIAALGMIESLLCGASAGKMKGEKLNADRELVAQGIGNMIVPFCGGVPATAAIARTSVAIKSGAQTRLTGIFHAVGLLLSMFLLAGIMKNIPLSALAGVLMITAWRMNDWEDIKFIFKRKLKMPIAQFLITMIATVVFDLTTAILIGVGFSILAFIVKASDIQINMADIEEDRLNININYHHNKTKVVYITGPIFFTTVQDIEALTEKLVGLDYVIFSMRGVPLIDLTGLKAISDLADALKASGTHVMFAGVQEKVKNNMARFGIDENIGGEQFFWSVEDTLVHIDKEELSA